MNHSIIFITTSFPRTVADEAGIFVLRLVQALSEHGERGTVIAPKDTMAETINDVGNFAIKRIRYGIFKTGSLAYGAGIMPNLRRAPLRIFQVPTLFATFSCAAWRASNRDSLVSAQWIFSALPAYAVSVIRKVPFTVTIRGEDLRLLRHPFLGLPFRFALRRAAAIISVSRAFQDEVRAISGIDKNRVHLIENGVEMPTLSANASTTHPLPFEKPYILFVGTVIPRKNIAALIEMLASSDLEDYSLIICGRLDDKEEHERLSTLAETLHIASRVHFEGAVSPEMVAYYLHHAAAYVSASTFEGRPNAVLEALASGKIAFLSDIPAHQEIVTEGKNGAFFDSGSPKEAAVKLAKLLSSDTEANAMRTEARRSVSHLTWERAATQYQKIAKEIISQR